MTESPQVLDLLLRWQEQRDMGREPTAEELCAACPELVDAVRAGIQRLRRIDRRLDVENSQPSHRNTISSADENTGPWVPRPDRGTAKIRDLLAPGQTEGELGRLAHYRVLKELGHGGMGMVLLAEDTQLQRRVALKVILPQDARDPQVQARFLREARAAAKLKHDNVVTIYQVGEERGILFIAMELLKGSSLEDYLRKQRDLTPGQIVRLAREMVEGLKAAHAVGLIHRDIKPANIWLEAPKGRIKLLDFGLARDERADGRVTLNGAIIGTPKYMSPEQADGQLVDARSDLFSLGVVLYRLCTGKQPFTGDSMMAVLKSLAIDIPTPIRELNPDIPPELASLIERMMVKDPNQRVQTAVEVADALQAIKKALAVGTVAGAPEVLDLPIDRIDDPAASSDGNATERRQKTRAPSTPIAAKQPAGKRLRWAIVALGSVLLVVGSVFITRAVMRKDSTPKPDAVAIANPEPLPVPSRGDSKKSDPAPAGKQKSDPISIPPKDSDPGGKVGPDKMPPPADRKVREEEVVINGDVKMKFCWIPAGRATLGSPMAEKDRSADEVEHEFTTTGFWLGKYAVTQEEWTSVMGSNPSSFSRDGTAKQRVVGLDTSRFPVECVSWRDCQTFLQKLNEKQTAVPKAMGSGKFALPQEDQWEYACRGGKGNQQPFYFGNSLDGTQANCNGASPYGAATKGPYLRRTQEVGWYESAAFHPWGLCDMAGNVWQWCDNKYDNESGRRVLRGGAFNNSAAFCRSAARAGWEPVRKTYDNGFRVAYLP